MFWLLKPYPLGFVLIIMGPCSYTFVIKTPSLVLLWLCHLNHKDNLHKPLWAPSSLGHLFGKRSLKEDIFDIPKHFILISSEVLFSLGTSRFRRNSSNLIHLADQLICTRMYYYFIVSPSNAFFGLPNILTFLLIAPMTITYMVDSL